MDISCTKQQTDLKPLRRRKTQTRFDFTGFHLPKLNGFEVARRLRELAPSSKIVFFRQENSAGVVQEALNLGAWGYESDALTS